MEKRRILTKDDIIDISITNGYAGEELHLTRSYRIGKEIRNLKLSLWDDIAFNAYTTETVDTVEFTFDIHDLFYFCLNHFLGEDKELYIEDDDTYGDGKKYLSLSKENYTMKLVFKNLLEESEYPIEEKFRIFIKNIGPDPRSKIEDDRLKYRMVEFIRECVTRLLEEYHQITIEEYLEMLHYNQDQEKNHQKRIGRRL